jgi:hypothetical protein
MNKADKKYRKNTLWIEISTFVFMVITIIISIWSVQENKLVAIQSGAFEEAVPELKILNYTLNPNVKTELIFGKPEIENALQLGRLPILINNTGEKSLRNVTVTYRFPIIGNLCLDDESFPFNIEGTYIKGGVVRTVSTIEPFVYISHFYERINPEQKLLMQEPFRLCQTLIQDTISFPVIDGRFGFNYKAEYRFEIVITVSADDTKTIDYKIKVGCINADDMEILKKKYVQYVNELSKQQRNGTKFFKYFKSLLFDKKRETVLVYPELKYISEIEGEKLYFGNSKNDIYTVANYKLYSWKLLF